MDSRFALLGGSGVAIVNGDTETSYASLLVSALRYRDMLGEQRRLIFLETSNSVDAIAAYLGCMMGGHVVHLYAGSEMLAARQRAASLRPNVRIAPTDGVYRLDWIGDEQHRLHPDLRVLLATSGSTSAAKFVKLSERNLLSNAEAIADYLNLGPAERAATTLDFAHAFGLSVVNAHLFSGGSLMLTDKSVIKSEFWDEFRRHGATNFSGVPFSFEMLKSNDAWASNPAITHVAQAGGRLAPDLVRHYAKLGEANGWRFHVMYGQTEASPRMAHLPPELAVAYPDCIGVAIPGGTIQILDEDGAPVTKANVPGELCYSGPNVMMGYVTAPEDLATDETPARLGTGDIAQRNEHGLYRIVGRASRFVKPFGIRVGLDDAQAVARVTAPSAICVGDDQRIVVAVLEQEAGAPVDDAIAAIAERFALPRFIFQSLILEAMPLLSSGKIDYRTLLESAAPVPASRQPDTGFPGLIKTFARRFAFEFTGIVGLRREEWESVEAIYETFVGVKPSSSEQSFRDLAGDSLSYVSTQLALEDYLGPLPDDWESKSIRELQTNRHDHHVL
jgi:acyl-CoA synthetase (AMP-forming)/AMP-acid ligase II